MSQNEMRGENSISASIIIAAVSGMIQGGILAMIIIGFILFSGEIPAINLAIIISTIYIMGGGILCAAVVPEKISWNNKELTIKRIWGIESCYLWSELCGISSYGIKRGVCFLQFKGRRIFYIGSYGFAAGDWTKFQTWMRQRFDDKISFIPRL